MASVLYCDPDVLGREPRVWCEAELGPESPLAFEDGHALVEDEDSADRLVRSRPPIEYAGSGGNGGDPSYFDGATDEDEEFDAEAFVDRTPMSDVVADIESGDYDDHLDAIEAAADRVGVQDAIDARGS